MADPDVTDLTDAERAALCAFAAPMPPPDLADRVLATLDRPAGLPRRRRAASRWVALAAVLLLGVFAGVALRPRGRLAAVQVEGEVTAGAQVRQPLGSRGEAVLEPGAVLRYAIAADGTGRVEQRRGTVRYRVRPGGPFLVITPVGAVQVVGTAFTVELVTMNRKPILALAAATTLILTVYEGRVLLGNPHGSLPVAAGSRASLTDETAPRPLDAPSRAQQQQARALSSPARPRDSTLPPVERERLLHDLAVARSQRQPAPPQDASSLSEKEKDYVRAQIREILPLIQECYTSALERDPHLKGRIVMNFTISGEPDLGGLVESAEVGEVKGNLGDPDLRECMRESMYALRLKPPQSGGQVLVKYPFVLRSGEDEPDEDPGADPDRPGAGRPNDALAGTRGPSGG